MGFLLLILSLFLAVLLIAALILFARRKPLQFSLRGLFIALTMVALLLSSAGWWRIANLAQVSWLDPTSPEAIALIPPSEIVPHEKGWSAAYTSRNRKIQSLTKALDDDGIKIRGSHSTRWYSEASRIEFVVEEREELERYLTALQNADKLGPGEVVIRGRVEDRDGTPVPDAIVDLMGPYVYINHFKTGDDGTFVMASMTPHETWGYYLRIRPRTGEERTTSRFSLRDDDPEHVVIIRVP